MKLLLLALFAPYIQGMKVPGNESSRKRKFHGAKVPRTGSETCAPGNGLGSIKSVTQI